MNKILIVVIILILLAGDIFLGVKYYLAESQLQKVSSTSSINQSVLTFDKLFVDKVLMAEGETSAEDRLSLENAVINTKDQEIINNWHSFLQSTTETDAQQRVLTLLDMFPNKIIY